MVNDNEVWRFIRERRDFVRFTEIKRALNVSDQRLSRALKRLERDGSLFRSIGYYNHKPVHVYLAIDPDNPNFDARIVDNHGWLIVIFEWLDENGLPYRSISENLGGIGDYVTQKNERAVINWPAWVESLQKVGRLIHQESS